MNSITTFEFNGKTYEIFQDTHDESMFGIWNSEKETWEVVAMGEEAAPDLFDMNLPEMHNWLLLGIERFTENYNWEDLLESEYADLFCNEADEIEHYGDPENAGPITQEYVICKLHCCIENAKWCAATY
jgi:hypothetical protein